MKRFWTHVTVVDGSVLLDDRPVRTPARARLVLPNASLAEAVADEWRAVGEDIDPRAMPLTGLANAAIDRVGNDLISLASTIAGYGESDLLCYRAEAPPELVQREAEVWNPLLDWAERRYDVAFTLVSGIGHRAQPRQTVARLGQAVAARNAFELVALSHIVTIGGSLVIALMLAENAIGPDDAFDAAHLDELWQAELWGEDGVATEARRLRRRDFCSAARLLSLL